MRKLFAIVLLLNSLIYSQTEIQENHVLYLSQGFVLTNLNSLGISNIKNSVSNIGTINPSAMIYFDKIGIGGSYHFETNIEEAYLASIGHKRISKELPQSIGIVFPYQNFRLGIAFNQKYNSSAEFDRVPITTSEFPDGTGEYYKPIMETIVLSYSVSASYQFENFVLENSSLAFGARLTRNSLDYREELLSYSFDANSNNYNWVFGVLFNHVFDIKKSFSVGVFYESNNKMNETIVHSDQNLNVNPNFSFSQFSLIYSANFPAKVSLDLSANVINNISLYSTVNYLLWNDAISNLKNQIEFSCTGLYSIDKNLKASFGFFLTDRNYEENILGLNEKLRAIYLIAGINYQISLFNCGLSIADSHLFSDEWRKQTIAKFEVEINF
ncbi:MAG: hypothetical protein M5R37_06795 [Melioribacteraceae bacterium]|nr:hypothetical protein [Melioribacteraceae bacterium]